MAEVLIHTFEVLARDKGITLEAYVEDDFVFCVGQDNTIEDLATLRGFVIVLIEQLGKGPVGFSLVLPVTCGMVYSVICFAKQCASFRRTVVKRLVTHKSETPASSRASCLTIHLLYKTRVVGKDEAFAFVRIVW